MSGSENDGARDLADTMQKASLVDQDEDDVDSASEAEGAKFNIMPIDLRIARLEIIPYVSEAQHLKYYSLSA